ncbi:hypothetical protein HFN89_03545 [Rhizobium laguerreae]|nr:hypothetical protein [Rhizobium laguerreae]
MEDPKKETKSRFGSKIASEMYARLKRISSESKVLKVYEVETTETEVRIKIFNSWLLTRDLRTEAVGAFERDYRDGSWYPVEPSGIFHSIPVWPIHNLRSGVASGAKKLLLDKLYAAADYHETRDRLAAQRTAESNRLVEREGMDRNAAFELALERHPDLHRLEIAKTAFANKLFGSTSTLGKKKPTKGYVGHDAVYNALKGVRAAFFRQFKDPELFRAILAMNHKSMTLGDYLYFAANREAVLKVWKERRNLVPLLPYIGRDYWGGDELFSTANWTDRAGPLVDPGFNSIAVRGLPSQNAGRGTFSPFASVKAYQWLARSRNTVVKTWARTRKDPQVAEFMAELNLPKDTAVLVIANIVDQMDGALLKIRQEEQIGEHRQRVLRTFRAYAAHWAAVRKERGYRQMIAALTYENQGTGDVFDYLVNEGFAQDLPARNATWTSILRRSDDWHRRIAERYRNMAPAAYGADQARLEDENLPREWTSLVSEQTILDCRVRPLGKYDDVVAEGGEMAHCVGSYAPQCARDGYRVYSITEPDGARATLGIWLHDGSAYFDQVQGYQNSRPSDLLQKVAHKVVALYVEAIAAERGPERKAA